MIPGLGASLGFSGGSSGASSAIDSNAHAESGITLNASKGIQAKDLLAFAPLALVGVVGLVVVVKTLK